jgi:hypothetical protein
MNLIPGAKRLWFRLWSIRLNAIGLALQTLFMTWASLPLDLWNMMPGEVKALVSPRVVFVVPALFFAAAMVARLIKQGSGDGR